MDFLQKADLFEIGITEDSSESDNDDEQGNARS